MRRVVVIAALLLVGGDTLVYFYYLRGIGVSAQIARPLPLSLRRVGRWPAPTRRDHLAAAAVNGWLYVAGGREQTLSKNLATVDKQPWRREFSGRSSQQAYPCSH